MAFRYGWIERKSNALSLSSNPCLPFLTAEAAAVSWAHTMPLSIGGLSPTSNILEFDRVASEVEGNLHVDTSLSNAGHFNRKLIGVSDKSSFTIKFTQEKCQSFLRVK